MSAFRTVGFIGLGVIGEPICRNLVKKSGARVTAFDLSPEPLQRLRGDGAEIAASVAAVVGASDVVFLCLPSAKHVRAVFEGDGIANTIQQGQIVVDLGTSSVSQTPRLRKAIAGQGRRLARCADRAHASGGAGWHAQCHGRRTSQPP